MSTQVEIDEQNKTPKVDKNQPVYRDASDDNRDTSGKPLTEPIYQAPVKGGLYLNTYRNKRGLCHYVSVKQGSKWWKIKVYGWQKQMLIDLLKDAPNEEN
jgi:hypothetical protein